MYIASWFKLHFPVEAVSYCPLVQMTFHSSPLIFICPDPILDHFYLITVLPCMFWKKQQVNSSNLLTIWIILCGSVAHNILVFTWSQGWHQCLDVFLIFHCPSVENYPCLSIQTKSWIPCLKPQSNKQQFTKLHQMLFSDKVEYVLPPCLILQSWCYVLFKFHHIQNQQYD